MPNDAMRPPRGWPISPERWLDVKADFWEAAFPIITESRRGIDERNAAVERDRERAVDERVRVAMAADKARLAVEDRSPDGCVCVDCGESFVAYRCGMCEADGVTAGYYRRQCPACHDYSLGHARKDRERRT